MRPDELLFRRRFSVNLHHTLRLKAGEMSLYQNWVDTETGDPYPRLSASGEIREQVGSGAYRVTGENRASVRRLLGSFFPWYTYEFRFSALSDACCGLCIDGSEGKISVMCSDDCVLTEADGDTYLYPAHIQPGSVVRITFRGGGFTVYVNGKTLADLDSPTVKEYCCEESFYDATASILSSAWGGEVLLSRVEWYLDGGISQADIRPVRYEDGTPMQKDGRVFLTLSSRQEVGCFQSVVSWNPSLCDFRMEGALFFRYDNGDTINSDVATSLLFDRTAGKWRLWVAAFSQGHILAHATPAGDPRYGINIIDAKTMKKASGGDLTAFLGFRQDEDPDFIRLDGKWHLSVCRVDPATNKYRYFHFISEKGPYTGYVYADSTPAESGEKTGGMFVRTDNGVVFICGSDFHNRAVYDVYPLDDFSDRKPLRCDYDDGGFRGWGSVMLLPYGSRHRYVWITFDRFLASQWGWSYGNVYVFDTAPF